MVKTLDVNAHYDPNKRSWNWLKLKKDYLDSAAGDSLDLVVVGCDIGAGKNAGLLSTFLLACWNEETQNLEAVSKVGCGFTDENMAKFTEEFKALKIDHPPSNLKYKVDNVDMWCQPKVVWEIRVADLILSTTYVAARGQVEDDKAICLRFARYIRTRDDKKYTEATSTE